MIVDEPRSCRLDWERSSIYVNIGNSFTRQGNFEKAFEEYATAEKLGKEHVEVEIGNKVEGMGIMIVAMRARSFALKKASKDDEAKKQMREVLDMKSKLTAEQEKQKAEHQAIAEKEQAAAKAAADAASTKPQE
jgi:regulator of protease activity HflC (stomatin/prohibitin superfamily)